MNSSPTVDAIEAQLDELCETISHRIAADQAGLVLRFARLWIERSDPEDLVGRSTEDLYGTVLSQWNFLRRHPGGTRIRVFNPRLEEHGWESRHTVIEVVSDDMPFLVDSVTLELNRQGIALHLITHPVLGVERDPAGQLLQLFGPDEDNAPRYESVMHLEVDRRTEENDLSALKSGLEHVLKDVRAAVEDWPAMRERLAGIIAQLESAAPTACPVPEEERTESLDFLRWLAEGHLVLLGCRDYDLVVEAGRPELLVQEGSGLGLLRAHGSTEANSRAFAALPDEARAQAQLPVLLTINKSRTRSTVHRGGYLDIFGVRCFDAQGSVCGERRIIGLMTSTAYNARPRFIPILRSKVQQILERSGYRANSHAAKALLSILEQYPRDELFQISLDDLHQHALGILRLGERQRTRLFVRKDPYGRFVSCLIFVPREHYNTEQRQRIQTVLSQTLGGCCAEFEVHFSESALARILIIVRMSEGQRIPPINVQDIEQRLIRAARRWEDDLQQALLEHFGEEHGLALMRRYGNAFPAGYREHYTTRTAVFDIEQMESLSAATPLAMSLYVPLEAQAGRLNFKLYSSAQIPLSQSLPMLEHMGVTVTDERPADIACADGSRIWIHDFGLNYAGAESLKIEMLRPLFQESFLRAWRGEIESDDFNRLTLLAGLDWREIAMLRAYARHMRQATFTFSQPYMEQTLASHPPVAAKLVELFRSRFDPQRMAHREEHTTELNAEIEAELNSVANLDEDRILRQFHAMILATLRTNFFQTEPTGEPKSYLSLKLNPTAIPNLPQPLPMFEIFVYSPRVEGVHLRGGKVARGGLRWSDRMEDFRTEVLGLVKAQIVKNAVIVPVGSKGGFVVKNLPAPSNREAWLAEGIACYRTFLCGLLDLTDNLLQGSISPPQNVVRYDGDDPYLVVAADKGTASFSDTANAVAADYGFWLGDAFASGGSVGYDHKKMGITARGAWESVKRHFRELGIDIQNEPFRVVGIGDMSGDVFGNGMLLSRKIQLVAAFDHRHIFVDPNPNPETSWEERARLFALPRSSWQDYNPERISAGGGVWSRSLKSIRLTPEIRAALDIEAQSLPPNELIRAILRAPVDLLYNGGIGTYIRSSRENDAAAGDRSNDALRVSAAELRCRVLGEGGNLGITQLGRIEFAQQGGRINTDAIDNSGGVDCSDHEVNIKILLNAVIADGELTAKQRNHLLAEMTDEVAELVLRDNYAQTQVISVAEAEGVSLLDEQVEYIRQLSHNGKLNRRIEFLPLDEEIIERKSQRIGLLRPELAVLLAYSKIELYDEIVASNVPEDPYLRTALLRYFPSPLRERFTSKIESHPLRREIIATHVVNSMVNRVGPTFVHRMKTDLGANAAEIVRAYMATREVFGLVSLWRDIEALDNRVDTNIQIQMILEIARLVRRGTLWFLRHPEWIADLAATLKHFSPGVSSIVPQLAELISTTYRNELEIRKNDLIQSGISEKLAHQISTLTEWISALDLVEVAATRQRDVNLAATVHFKLAEQLHLHWLNDCISSLSTTTHWQSRARSALRAELASLARTLTANALEQSPEASDGKSIVSTWLTEHEHALSRYHQLTNEIRESEHIDLSMLSVLLRELRSAG